MNHFFKTLLFTTLLLTSIGLSVSGNSIDQNTVPKKTVRITEYGVIPNSTEDQTDQIQKAFKDIAEKNYKLVIDKGIYYISGVGEADNKMYLFDRGGIKVYSNSEIVFEEGATFKVLPNSFSAYNALRIWNAKNVKITGGTLIGERDEHKGTTGEWGYGVFIGGSSNVTIKNMKISDFWGDGINLNCSVINEVVNVNRKILIDQVYSLNNRRQGMSIEAGRDIVVKNSKFENNRGTNPQGGIDIEPWGEEYENVQNVTIDSCLFVDNPIGVLVNFPTLKDIFINNCTFQSTKKGSVLRHFWQLYGENEVSLNNCNFDKNAHNILINSGKKTSINLCSFNNFVVVDSKTPVDIKVMNSKFNNATISVLNPSKGIIDVKNSFFAKNSKIELRGHIKAEIVGNKFSDSDNLFISDVTSSPVLIRGNNFNQSKIEAITTIGNSKIMNNTSSNSEVFLVLRENASNVNVSNNVVSTKIKEAFNFQNPSSNKSIEIKNNATKGGTKIINSSQKVLLNDKSNRLKN